ncbi:hypothetical protein C7N43_10090 [Sphingobacteriales bacterium UPWRP_1]|nr:hypothetical protein B6N25_12195 [Sphingobacteriales bacterium TSM_CSS]PSJ77173.1 hypothetical protein C7N43_10090 [Sphingobacteriales bacterium UPWRP_1]
MKRKTFLKLLAFVPVGFTSMNLTKHFSQLTGQSNIPMPVMPNSFGGCFTINRQFVFFCVFSFVKYGLHPALKVQRCAKPYLMQGVNNTEK